MKWLAKDRFNYIDAAGIFFMTAFLRDDEFLKALLTLIATCLLSAAACVIAKKGRGQ